MTITSLNSKILIFMSLFCFLIYPQSHQKTTVTKQGNKFYINGELTYKSPYWKVTKTQDLLMNSKMVQGVFEDLNPNAVGNLIYPNN